MSEPVKYINDLGQVRWQPRLPDGRRMWQRPRAFTGDYVYWPDTYTNENMKFQWTTEKPGHTRHTAEFKPVLTSWWKAGRLAKQYLKRKKRQEEQDNKHYLSIFREVTHDDTKDTPVP